MNKIVRSIFRSLPEPIRKPFNDWRRKRAFQVEYERLRAGVVDGYSMKPFDERRCIFVHIPKTAGVSVAKSLFGNLAGGHTRIATYKKVFSPEEFHSYFKFTFVRNPWDRVVSAFTFLKGEAISEWQWQWAHEHLAEFDSFEDFVLRWLTDENIPKGTHFDLQSGYVCDSGDEPEVDYIGHFETLANDFSWIAEKLGVQAQLAQLNASKHRDYRGYYSDRTAAIVEKVYERDIEMFGYDFDNKRWKNL
jgi:hypothetical protein